MEWVTEIRTLQRYISHHNCSTSITKRPQTMQWKNRKTETKLIRKQVPLKMLTIMMMEDDDNDNDNDNEDDEWNTERTNQESVSWNIR